MKSIPFCSEIAILLLITITGCNGQQERPDLTGSARSIRVGGDCEAGYCEIMYKGMPGAMDAVDTSAGWYEKGQRMIVTGIVYHRDGKTPAPDVIIYYHHTDNNGYYSPRDDKPENQTRHGHIRGWVKSGADGKYSIYTNRPAPYPNQQLPAHIHWLIKEPDIGNEYWVDDLVFADDELLSSLPSNQPMENRGGNGLSQVDTRDGIQYATRNFILGLNIPHYPERRSSK